MNRFKVQFLGSGGGLKPLGPCDDPPTLQVVIGAIGQAQGTDIAAAALDPISGGRAVAAFVEANGIRHAQSNSSFASATFGVSRNAANVGDAVNVCVSGKITDSSWNWATGPIWLTENGIMSQVPPEFGTLVIVGVAINQNTMRVDPQIIGVR